ncbi:MAG: MBL fold metallo-hydrolase, partial [Planctomycetaceae bacterium]|nr:MBL fold metallo-hydrolase [Planctomycetaceae bacterium]
PPSREGLRCTFLSVGHGCAVVLELPGGETVMYDAGTIGDARRGAGIIENALWERGITRLDAIVISHADVDHFNATVDLMNSISVGAILCHRTFLDLSQKPVAALCEAAARAGVPVRLLQKEDCIRFGRSHVEFTVLHPPPEWTNSHDNANSLVLRVRYADRTLLLTGDLEREGLLQLLEQAPNPVDLLLSPHHGSVSANPAALSAWASPRYVVISGGDARSEAALQKIYHGAEAVVSTAQAGAVKAHIHPNGEMRMTRWIGDE